MQAEEDREVYSVIRVLVKCSTKRQADQHYAWMLMSSWDLLVVRNKISRKDAL